MKNINIVIIDDHEIFIQGLQLLIEKEEGFNVVGKALDFFSGEELVSKLKPDVAIVDLNLQDKDGLELIKIISTKYPKTKVLVLSMMQEKYYAQRSINSGARGYLMKDVACDTVINAINTIVQGKIYLSEQEQKRYMDSLLSPDEKNSNLIEGLSNRQLEVFRLLGNGQGTIEIAKILSLSTKTVDAHKEQLKKKLNCANSQELLRLAILWNKSNNTVM